VWAWNAEKSVIMDYKNYKYHIFSFFVLIIDELVAQITTYLFANVKGTVLP
jgi:hypothetical protein